MAINDGQRWPITTVRMVSSQSIMSFNDDGLLIIIMMNIGQIVMRCGNYWVDDDEGR